MPGLIRLRNVTRDELVVSVLGNRAVGPDCVIDITARQYQHHPGCRTDDCTGCLVWPESVWRNETPATRERPR